MNRRTLRQLSIVAASLAALLVPASLLSAQVINRKYGQEDKFRQLDEILPTPNDYRTASGAPGHELPFLLTTNGAPA